MSKDKLELATEAELLSANYETFLCVHVDAWREFCRKHREEIVAALRASAVAKPVVLSHKCYAEDGYPCYTCGSFDNPAPAAAPRLHTTFCGDCQTHYFNHERHLCAYPTSV